MMKKLLAIILSAVMLLSLAACAAEDITPKEDEKPGISVEEKVPKEEVVEYELGYLVLDSKCYEDKINPVVMYLDSYEDCQSVLDHSVLEQMKDSAIPELRERYAATMKYTEDFFAEKELIVLVWYVPDGSGTFESTIKSFTCLKEEGQKPSYCITYEFNPSGFGSDAVATVCEIYVIEVDKSLDINSENLTVEVIDKSDR